MDVKSILYNHQLGLCCSCKQSLPINKLEMHHLKSLSQCEFEQDQDSVTNINNLVLLCRTCNAKQSNKLDNRFS